MPEVMTLSRSHLIQLPNSAVADPVKTRGKPSIVLCLARHRSRRTSANG
jgi:hypothetical protein